MRQDRHGFPAVALVAAALVLTGCGFGSAEPDRRAQRLVTVTSAPATDAARTTVSGDAPRTDRIRYAAMGDRALAWVREDLSLTEPRRLEVVAPADIADFATRAGGATESLREVAAVTTGPRDSGAVGDDEIVVNPEAFARLTPAGQQFVLTHESVHVALRAQGIDPLATWLVEGLADHVAYRHTDRPREVLAADLLDAVRRGEGPSRLPRSADFEPGSPQLSRTYLAAWLAVEEINDRYGSQALSRLVRAAVAPPGADPEATLDVALAEVLGTSRAELTTQWLAALQQLSRRALGSPMPGR